MEAALLTKCLRSGYDGDYELAIRETRAANNLCDSVLTLKPTELALREQSLRRMMAQLDT